MNGSNKKKVQTSSIYPPYNSLKSYPDTETAKYSGVLMLSYYQICIFISGRSKFNMDWGLFFFFQDWSYFKLLIIMFIRMFDKQY